MQGKGDMKRGSSEIGAACENDWDCASGYCKCYKDEDPWTAKCGENPKVCVKIMGNPDIGCDFIGFLTDRISPAKELFQSPIRGHRLVHSAKR